MSGLFSQSQVTYRAHQTAERGGIVRCLPVALWERARFLGRLDRDAAVGSRPA